MVGYPWCCFMASNFPADFENGVSKPFFFAKNKKTSLIHMLLLVKNNNINIYMYKYINATNVTNISYILYFLYTHHPPTQPPTPPNTQHPPKKSRSSSSKICRESDPSRSSPLTGWDQSIQSQEFGVRQVR